MGFGTQRYPNVSSAALLSIIVLGGASDAFVVLSAVSIESRADTAEEQVACDSYVYRKAWNRSSVKPLAF